MKRIVSILVLLVITLSIPLQVTAEAASSSDTPEPYTKEEFPQWAIDLRRFEIVSLGAVPFAAISVNLGYSAFQYFSGNSDSFHAPFSGNSSLSEGEQMKIFCLSIGTGVLIGTVDLAICLAKRRSEKKRLQKIQESHDQIIVVPFQEAENADTENSNSEQ
ncbi:hypothetical protein [Treponema sp.]|uniref:hypothetical protein n=1 Tax=Treponema sp. TaxID=166 RepID=UPI003EFF877F